MLARPMIAKHLSSKRYNMVNNAVSSVPFCSQYFNNILPSTCYKATLFCIFLLATHYFGNNLYIKSFEIDILLLANALLVNTYTLFDGFVGFVYLSVGLWLNILGFLIGFFHLVLEVLDSDSITVLF